MKTGKTRALLVKVKIPSKHMKSREVTADAPRQAEEMPDCIKNLSIKV